VIAYIIVHQNISFGFVSDNQILISANEQKIWNMVQIERNEGAWTLIDPFLLESKTYCRHQIKILFLKSSSYI
jgi:hypothetical protein